MVVGVCAELDESSVDDVVQCADIILTLSRALLPASSRGQMPDRIDELDDLLHPLGSETQLVVLSRSSSVSLYFICRTSPAVVGLRDRWRTAQLSDIVEKLFTFLSCNTYSDGRTREVRVKRLTWPLAEYERCLEFFSSLQGKQTI